MITNITEILPSGTFSTSGVNTEPDPSTRVSGMIANEGLPAEYWNYYINMLTVNMPLINTGINSLITECNNVLSAASIIPNSGTTNQLLLAIEYLIDNNINPQIIHFTNTTNSTAYNNGALILDGGLGIAKDLTLQGKGNFVRGASIIVASSDSLQNSQNGADVVIPLLSDAGVVINAQITALNAAGGGTIQLMEGTYNITTNILPLSKVNIFGMGMKTILNRNSATLSQIILVNSGIYDVAFKDFEVNGGGITITGANSYGINQVDNNPANNISYENILVANLILDNASYYNYAFSGCTNMVNCIANSINGEHATYVDGFQACVNLINCIAVNIISLISGNTFGFSNCSNLTNCNADSNISNNNNTSGFSNCSNLTNCNANSNVGANTYGFANCSFLTNCNANSNVGNNTNTSGFANCSFLTNCNADSNVSDLNTFGFSNCSFLTNCNANNSHGPTAWGYNECTRMQQCTGYENGNGLIYTNCFADNDSNPAAMTVAGGYNG